MDVLERLRLKYSFQESFSWRPACAGCVFIMAIQNLTAIENMLSQMRQVAQAAANLPARNDALPGEQGGFAAELAKTLDRVSEMQSTAKAQTEAFQAGVPGIALNDVMIDSQKASIAFQATLQVRNRLIQAYQDVASMPV